ncbi:putative transcriptional regulator of N-Acetylglucosamine utilization, GntR family [Salisediminibacterium beveridgei]|uniref:Putative transcriptional regulator of N-Acetylglucosamine utilization, GntR family n=2 Tax=Salisediminibacterium beveridgei TaxID=632773 RepID=A0A1D7QZS2_9BACI|nr:putative transcriptional regulator of N-Acetylglucosamine utilization, GntR family [Salisediminibacterium beveridgei]
MYYQLQEMLRKLIESGDLKPGDPIPSERELSEQHDISRMTIRQALTNLVNEGLLTRSKGRGTFVAEEKIEQPLMKLTGFSEDMRLRGIEPGSRLIQFDTVKAGDNVAKYLEIDPGTKVYQISRLRLGDGAPMAYETSFLRMDGLLLKETDLQGSLYALIEATLNKKIARARQTIEPSFATEDEAELLTVETGSPVLLLERITRFDDGTVFEYVKSAYRGDRYKFIADMQR